jgi:lipopolysaccharide biosynthesis glycosyltransferase
VFVLRPSHKKFKCLKSLKDYPSLEFETMSEQGFLNVVFANKWYEISFENNANLAVYSSFKDYWIKRENDNNIIHYTMPKPSACLDEYRDVCEFWKFEK